MKAKVEGDVMLSAVVRTDGTPGDVEVTKSLDPNTAWTSELWPLSASGGSSRA